MRMVTVKMPDLYVRIIDEMVERGVFGSRSEAIRYAIAQLARAYLREGERGILALEARLPRRNLSSAVHAVNRGVNGEG